MKIQCDFCAKNEASIFCSADDAALCIGCDHEVHLANKLASKHNRFSLLSSAIPICDICQEKKALLFCQQDRAILCRDCDVPIHSANELTQKHNRFLLTGIKLSPISDLPKSTTTTTTTSNTAVITSVAGVAATKVVESDLVPEFKSQALPTKKPMSIQSQVSTPFLNSKPLATSNTTSNYVNLDSLFIYGGDGGPAGGGGGGGGCTSSISEYLMEMLPGWQVDDFLESASAAPFGFSKGTDEDLASFWDSDLGKSNRAGVSEKMGIWVPQAPPVLPQQAPPCDDPTNGGLLLGGVEKIGTWRKVGGGAKKWMDDGFTVPHITSSHHVGTKRPRPFW